MVRKDPDVRRMEIIATALRLFQQHGYEAVRIDDILKSTELSKGGFYHHFASKDDLLRAIIREEVHAVLAPSSEETADPTRELIAMLQRGSSQAGADPGVLETLSSFQARTTYLDELEAQFERHLKPFIDRLVARGVSAGTFRPVDSATTAEVFVAVNNHGNRLSVLGNRAPSEVAAFSATALEMLGRHLGIEEELGRVATAIRNGGISND